MAGRVLSRTIVRCLCQRRMLSGFTAVTQRDSARPGFPTPDKNREQRSLRINRRCELLQASVCPSWERQTQRRKFKQTLSGYGEQAQEPPITWNPSMCTPGAATASSVPIRKRILIVCPLKLAGRLIVELM